MILYVMPLSTRLLDISSQPWRSPHQLVHYSPAVRVTLGHAPLPSQMTDSILEIVS